jgi:hypothetical protein
MRNVVLFFAIFISVSACQQERVNPEPPEATQEDTLKKEYPPKANHVTKHMAEVTDSVDQAQVYAEIMEWPYDTSLALDSQINLVEGKLAENFGLTLDPSRVKMIVHEEDTTDILYHFFEHELVVIRRLLDTD